MRKRQTFLLTILSEEDNEASFCGRVKVISSGKTCTFTNLEELNHVIVSEMETEVVQLRPRLENARVCSSSNDPTS